ncbi:MAG TPA: surface-adhesin E family protein [Nitrospira sp.]|nr:surface-adhesin E family protein [Nitrospira sp.]
MKVLLLAMGLLLASVPVYGEWEMIGVSDTYKATVYLDYATVRRTGTILTMRELFDYETKQSLAGRSMYLSHTTEREYDCAAELSRVLIVKWFSGQMGSGNVVDSLNLVSNWTVVERGSIAEMLWIAGCKHLNERR